MSLSSLYLDAFVAVVRTKNFTQAGERLHITQSALSQRIHHLEAELETPLLIRDRSGVRLTPVGERLLRYCQMKDGLEEEFLSEVHPSNKTESAGVVRVGSFSSMARSVLLPAVANLAALAPIQVSIMTREFSELPGMLRRAEVDLIVTGKKIDREDMEAIFLGNEEYVLVRSARHRSPQSGSWYLDHDEEDEITFQYCRKFTSKKKSHQTVRRRYLDEIYSLIDGVKLGLGQAVLPRHLVQVDRDLEVVDPLSALKIPVWLHHWTQPYYSKLHQELVSAIRSHAEKVLVSS